MPFRQILVQLQNLFKSISLTRRIVLLTIAVGSVAGFVFLMNWAGNPEFHPLYTNLDANDAGTILNRLKEQKIPYRLSANGSTILIPQEKIYEIRMQLASEGLPHGGSIGFELFDNTKLGMTEFAQRINYQRALEGELTRTIMALEEVKFARVHIVMPEGGLFESEQGAPSASVTLFLKSGRRPAEGQIRGVQNLVSAAVPRLAPMQVTVTDDGGLTLSQNGGDAPVERVSDQLEKKMEVERYLAQKVNDILAGAFGPNQAMVSLDVVLNFNESTITTENIVPTGGGSVEQLVERPGGIERLSVGVVVPAGTSEERRQAIGELVAATVGLDRGRGDTIALYSLAAPAVAAAGLEVDTEGLAAASIRPCDGSRHRRGGVRELSRLLLPRSTLQSRQRSWRAKQPRRRSGAP